ncbi:MAG TPA: hypothetical protein VHX14_14570 [Thermoanaerobaculia bacterium]|nr:hypothetical protein [Thermoanaerobaculia bacterium]
MITPRVTYLASLSLIGILVASIPVTMWLETEIGETGAHGPVRYRAAVHYDLCCRRWDPRCLRVASANEIAAPEY